ncbi:oligosaccharide flippase family protein [Mycobacterium sp. 3519A]|uniref:oligosaccharide flippase family protein n=1 Tax=Mycobacterium sp. 3519A TaxID=2057184 RepID=UPI000C7D9AE6|nr:oligosaccharide flippase family protein [Mycobacterium sp. 3519A]
MSRPDKVSERARAGVLWLGFVNVATKGSQMVVTLALAAVFTEGELGLVALTLSLANTAMIVQSMGVNNVITHTGRDEHVMAGTALTMSLVPTTVLTLVGVLGASHIARAFDAPGAAPLIAIVAVGLPFWAFGWFQTALMNRRLDFRRRLLPDVGSAAIGATVTLVLALRGVGPVSAAIGVLVLAVLQPFFALLVGVRVRPTWDRGAAGEALHWIMTVGAGAVVYTVMINVNFPIVSRLLGVDALGLYSLAFRVGMIPYLLAAVVLSAVAFPLYARLIREGRRDELAHAVAQFTHVLLLGVGGLYVILALLSGHLVIFGERWAPAVPALVALCLYGLGLSLLTLWYQGVIVSGRLRQYLCFEIAHLALLVGLLLMFARSGITAAAIAQTAAVWTVLAAAGVAVYRAKVAPPLGDSVRAIWGFLIPAAACVVLVVVSRWLGIEADPGSLLGAVCELIVLAGCYCGIAVLTNRSLAASLIRRQNAEVQ